MWSDATHYGTMQQTANALQHPHTPRKSGRDPWEYEAMQDTATRCNTLQHTATNCNTPLTHCNTHTHLRSLHVMHQNTNNILLKHTTTHCNTLQHNTNTLQHTHTPRKSARDPWEYEQYPADSSWWSYPTLNRGHAEVHMCVCMYTYMCVCSICVRIKTISCRFFLVIIPDTKPRARWGSYVCVYVYINVCVLNNCQNTNNILQILCSDHTRY